jgi:hypothetical protein
MAATISKKFKTKIMTTFEEIEAVVLYAGFNDGQITDLKRGEEGLPKFILTTEGGQYNITERKDFAGRVIYQWEGVKN